MVHSLLSMGSAAALGLLLASGDAPPPPHGPPPEAFEACTGKSEGATCTVTFHDKSLEGTCVSPPPNDAGESRLLCAPPRPPPPPDHAQPHD